MTPIRHFRLYRAARVAWAVLNVLPRYALLNLREQRGGATTQEEWDRVHWRAAHALRDLALDLAGAFTKAAQIGGARADILPEPFIETLSQFHDAVPPRPWASLWPLVESELPRGGERELASVEPEALAAASLAQVHRAKLSDGSDVVVKIQYPEVKRIIPLDFTMLRMVVAIASRMQDRIDLSSMVNEVVRFIQLELDFAREADSTERLAGILADDPTVVVPGVYRGLCSTHVLVLEYIEGIQVARTAELVKAGHRLPEVATRIGDLYGRMIFCDGFFHGDPHPGNLLVLPDGRIGLLDFGLCKELPPGFAHRVAEMMVCALIGDSEAALAAAADLGFDTDAIRGDHLRSLLLMVVGDSDSDDGLLDILSESRLRRIPEDFALMVRTLVLLNGLSHRLAPKRRLIQARILKHLAAGFRAGAELRKAS